MMRADDVAVEPSHRPGDAPEPLADLYARHHGDLVAFAKRRITRPEDAEDVIGQAFYKALRSSRGPGSARPSYPWLLRIARNLITDFYRTQKRDQPLDGVEPVIDSTESEVFAGLVGHRLQRAFACLTPQQRAVTRWRILEGRSYAEVATLLDTSEGAVRATQMRALRALRRSLATDDADEAASA